MGAKAWAYRKLKSIGRTVRNFQLRRHSEYFYYHDLHDIANVEAKLPVQVAPMKSGEEESIKEVWPVPLNRVKERLRRGDICYLTYYEGKVVAYHWVQVHGSHFVQPAGKTMTLNEKDFMIYHTRVTEVCKGKRINPYVICELLKDMKDRGMHRGLIYTASTNQANQKSLKRIGFRKLIEVSSFRVGKRYFSTWKPTV